MIDVMIKEYFLEFVSLTNYTGVSMTDVFWSSKNWMSKGIDIIDMRGQGYDNRSAEDDMHLWCRYQ